MNDFKAKHNSSQPRIHVCDLGLVSWLLCVLVSQMQDELNISMLIFHY